MSGSMSIITNISKKGEGDLLAEDHIETKRGGMLKRISIRRYMLLTNNGRGLQVDY
jgi:hypothetical protein